MSFTKTIIAIAALGLIAKHGYATGNLNFWRPSSSARPSSAIKNKVVILGGGFAGGSLAAKLQHDFDVVLVDKKGYFENICALFRVVVDPIVLNNNRLSFHNFLSNTKAVQGTVKEVIPEHKKVIVDDKEINYDYLVIATGAKYKVPFDISGLEGRLAMLTDGSTISDKTAAFSSAKSIAIIGGGPAGVEVAAEIAECHPEKHVYLIHSQPKLLNQDYPLETRQKIEEELRKISKDNLLVCLGERVVNVEPKDASGTRLVTSTGRSIDADYTLLCTGYAPNSEFLPRSMLNSNNTVKVNEYLQVEGYKDIFSLGDVAGFQGDRLAKTAMSFSSVVASNIRAQAFGGPMQLYPRKNQSQCVLLGRNNALVIGKDGVTDSGWLPAKKKQAFTLSADIMRQMEKIAFTERFNRD